MANCSGIPEQFAYPPISTSVQADVVYGATNFSFSAFIIFIVVFFYFSSFLLFPKYAASVLFPL